MESAAFISPRGQVASWYPFRAYLEKHLSYGIDESSRKEKTNRTLNIRNEKERKKRQTLTTSYYSSLSNTAMLRCHNLWLFKLRQRLTVLRAPDGNAQQASSTQACYLAAGTLEAGSLRHEKANDRFSVNAVSDGDVE